MASVWLQTKGTAQPKKLKGHMSIGRARVALEQYVQHYLSTASHAECKRMGTEVLLYQHGKLSALIYVETHPVPSADEAGQPKRKAEA